MPEQRRYTWKLYPTREQAEALHDQAHMIARLWNALLDQREAAAEGVRKQLVDCFAAPPTPPADESYEERRDRRRREQDELRARQRAARENGTAIKVGARAKTGGEKISQSGEITILKQRAVEWSELSCWSLLAVSDALELAFQAFYRRAKQGAGAASGYPRFKRTDRASAIPHRFASGCRLRPDEERHARAWALTVKGVPGEIHAHGTLPAPVEKFTNADLIYRDGYWWLSAACEIESRRQSRRATDIEIRWDLLDGMVRINGTAQPIDGVPELILDDRAVDEMRRDVDTRWPRHARLNEEEKAARQEALDEIWRRMAQIRRRRSNALHVWSARLVRDARAIHVVLPRLSKHIESGRGDAKEWGANVETIAHANRGILANGAAMATAMLKYKAEEAAIPCIIDTESEPEITVMRDLKSSGQKVRRASRQAKNEGRPQKRAA